MIIGFSGTRQGMTNLQRYRLRMMLLGVLSKSGVEFHHGDCVGADDQAALTACSLGCEIICHPPTNKEFRAFNKCHQEIRRERFYLARNADIVNESAILIACPAGEEEEGRSGTWWTILYAIKQHKPVIIIWPDGNVEERR